MKGRMTGSRAMKAVIAIASELKGKQYIIEVYEVKDGQDAKDEENLGREVVALRKVRDAAYDVIGKDPLFSATSRSGYAALREALDELRKGEQG